MINYTEFNESSVKRFDFYSDDEETTFDFLTNPNSFRSFDFGLIELYRRIGYNGDLNNRYLMANDLKAKLKSIGVEFEKDTIHDWFLGIHRPQIKASSRPRMYAICFALNLSLTDTIWFFHHVYYDRAFNCHTIDEAVYYFAFKNNLSYAQAQEIIATVKSADSINTLDVASPSYNYTHFIQDTISEFNSTEELIEFLIRNKSFFYTWNKTALEDLESLISELLGTEQTKREIDELKKLLKKSKKAIEENTCEIDLFIEHYEESGLLIKELFYDAQHASPKKKTQLDTFLGALHGKVDILARTFILDRILGSKTGLDNNMKSIPYIVKNNFPSKMVMSRVLTEDKISIAENYDAIRKLLVLLDFYAFWAKVKLELVDTAQFTHEQLTEAYIAEANNRLFHCGYEPLYAGNPYDWIFLCSANKSDPLYFFRDTIEDFNSI